MGSPGQRVELAVRLLNRRPRPPQIDVTPDLRLKIINEFIDAMIANATITSGSFASALRALARQHAEGQRGLSIPPGWSRPFLTEGNLSEW
jgi:hypothetical protein